MPRLLAVQWARSTQQMSRKVRLVAFRKDMNLCVSEHRRIRTSLEGACTDPFVSHAVANRIMSASGPITDAQRRSTQLRCSSGVNSSITESHNRKSQTAAQCCVLQCVAPLTTTHELTVL
jgi:hypothetical protein